MTPTASASRHVVVDGSNIATEGRSMPSLAQLNDAVAELRKDQPDAEVTVVVDATFAHRIDPSEREAFEAAVLRGELVSPPAGAIGRGDAFLLRIAEKVDGVVLSNDSFQEFHGEHPWLFDRGRLLGASPVPGIGWIFVLRSPVRGPKSRVATRDAGRERRRVEKAIAEATEEVEHPDAPAAASRRAPRPGASGTPQAVNGPAAFITFIADHPLGSLVEGEVEGFASHGAVIRFGETLCYVPLSGLANPAPKSAREVLKKGEQRSFVVTALDPYRRGIELALPEVAVVSGQPKEETVAAEVKMAVRPRGRARPAPTEPPAAEEARPAPARRSRRPVKNAPPSPELDGAPPEAVPVPAATSDAALSGALGELGAEKATPPASGRRRRAKTAVELPEAPPTTEMSPEKELPARATRRRRAGSESVLETTPTEAIASAKPAGSRAKRTASTSELTGPPSTARSRPRTRAAAASTPDASAPAPKRARRAGSAAPEADPTAGASEAPAASPRRAPRRRSATAAE